MLTGKRQKRKGHQPYAGRRKPKIKQPRTAALAPAPEKPRSILERIGGWIWHNGPSAIKWAKLLSEHWPDDWHWPYWL